MKTNGYQIREAIKRWELRRETASTQFAESLFAFPEERESRETPDDLMNVFLKAEQSIGQLQTAQTRYNLEVKVRSTSFDMTLCEAVKRIGGAGRAEKMWRTATSDKGRDRYQSREMSRSKDEIYAVRVLSVKETMKRAGDAAVFAGSLRAAIAEGNTRIIDIEGLDSKLFE